MKDWGLTVMAVGQLARRRWGPTSRLTGRMPACFVPPGDATLEPDGAGIPRPAPFLLLTKTANEGNIPILSNKPRDQMEAIQPMFTVLECVIFAPTLLVLAMIVKGEF